MGVDLLDFFRGTLSLRALTYAVIGLKKDSRVVKELTRRHLELDPGEEPWSDDKCLQVDIFNALHTLCFLTEYKMWASQDKKDRKSADKPQPPEMVRPPGWKPPKKKIATNREVRSFLAGLGKATIERG